MGLHRRERLSEEFRDALLGWVPSGFSVYVGPRIHPSDPEHFERLARYVVRVPMPHKDVRLTGAGQVRVSIPRHPRTGWNRGPGGSRTRPAVMQGRDPAGNGGRRWSVAGSPGAMTDVLTPGSGIQLPIPPFSGDDG